MNSTDWHHKVDRIIYINLDHRTDRSDMVMSEMKRLSFPEEKVIRFSALKGPGLPMVGTCLSHGAVLKMAYDMGLNNVLIFEDDCRFIEDVDQINLTMNTFFNDIKDWDALHLICSNKIHQKINHPLFNICVSSANAVAYLVSRKIMMPLSDTMYWGGDMLHKTGEHWHYQNDVVWDKFMGYHGKWYSMNHALCYQQPSYSDVSKTFMDYSHGNPMHLV